MSFQVEERDVERGLKRGMRVMGKGKNTIHVGFLGESPMLQQEVCFDGDLVMTYEYILMEV